MEGRDDAHGAGGNTGKDVGGMGKGKDYISSFDEYLRQGEPSKRENAANWQAAIGLQAVDGLRPSAYLLEVAGRNIEGEITLDESRRLIDSYYESKTVRTPKEDEEEEADWQIHAFCEGNTRTTAVFAIQYLRSLGFRVDNRMFALHSWYFRNALVRANYRNVQKDIDYTPIYLVRFFRNLLLGEKWDLKNRYLHIKATGKWGNLGREEGISDNANSRSIGNNSRSKVAKSRSKEEKLLEFCVVPRSLSEIAEFLGMKDKYYMKRTYIDPFLGKSLRMTEPNAPNSPTQKYVAMACVRG